MKVGKLRLCWLIKANNFNEVKMAVRTLQNVNKWGNQIRLLNQNKHKRTMEAGQGDETCHATTTKIDTCSCFGRFPKHTDPPSGPPTPAPVKHSGAVAPSELKLEPQQCHRCLNGRCCVSSWTKMCLWSTCMRVAGQSWVGVGCAWGAVRRGRSECAMISVP